MQLRIFPNHRDIRFEGRIHEQVIHSLEAKRHPHVPVRGRDHPPRIRETRGNEGKTPEEQEDSSKKSWTSAPGT